MNEEKYNYWGKSLNPLFKRVDKGGPNPFHNRFPFGGQSG